MRLGTPPYTAGAATEADKEARRAARMIEKRMNMQNEENNDHDIIRTLARLERYTPHFPLAEFKAHAHKVFLSLQKAWDEKNLLPVRPYIAADAFDKIQGYFFQDEKSCFSCCFTDEEVNIITVFDLKVRQEVLYIEASLYLKLPEDDPRRLAADFDDYTDDFVICNLFFRQQIITQGRRCLSCGAPVGIDSICAYCGSVFPQAATNGFTWLLTDYNYIF